MISVESTDSVVERDRISFWNSIVSDTFTSLAVSPIEPDGFNARIKRGQLVNIGVAEVFSSGSFVEHTRDQVCTETEAFFLAHLQLKGRSINRQGGREAILSAGDFTICDTTRPYSVSFDNDNTMLVLRLPEAHLRSILAVPEDLTCIPVRCRETSGNFASSVMTKVWRQLETDPNSHLQLHALERMVIDSLTIGFTDINTGGACQSALQRSRRLRIISYIESHLRDPELTPNKVAQAFNISARYMHQIFSTQGESVSQYVLRRRLELAAELLPRARKRGQTISDLAFGLGFNSLTHFGRVFREKYGLPPKEYLMKQVPRL